MANPPRPEELPALKAELADHLVIAKSLANRLGYQSCGLLIEMAIEDAKQHGGAFPVAAPKDLQN